MGAGKEGQTLDCESAGAIMPASILVIAENKLVCWSIKEILIREGYAADTACSQKDILSNASNNPYDLILADFETARDKAVEMQKIMAGLSPLTRVIVLSSFEEDQIRTLLPWLNVHAVVKKPFSVEEIIETARRAVERRI
jgi:DNA-binding NtrC family response regulator